MMWLWLIFVAFGVAGWLFWKALVYPEDAVELEWQSNYVMVMLAYDGQEGQRSYYRDKRYVGVDGWFFDQRVAWAYLKLIRAREKRLKREARRRAIAERRGQ